jgi:hypothetical protein
MSWDLDHHIDAERTTIAAAARRRHRHRHDDLHCNCRLCSKSAKASHDIAMRMVSELFERWRAEIPSMILLILKPSFDMLQPCTGYHT